MKELALSMVVGAALGKTFGPTFEAAGKRIGSLGKTVERLKLGRTQAGDIAKLQRQLAKLRAEQGRTGGGADRLAREIEDLERRIGAATREAARHGVQIGDAARDYRRLGAEIERAEGNLGRFQRRQARRDRRRELHGRALPAVGAAYAAGRVFQQGMDLEERTIRLRTVVNADDGDAEAAVGRSVAHAREVARRSLASEADLLSIQYELNSAGLSEAAARAGSEVTSKVAQVTKGDAAQVGKILGSAFNNLGASIEGASVEEKLARIGDVLAQTQFKFALSDFGQLGAGLSEAAAGAIDNRLSLEQTAVALGLLNNASVEGSSAGTALNAVLRQLGKASGELGFAIERDAAGNLDLAATLEGLEASLAIYDDLDERNQVLQTLFGDEGKRGLSPLLQRLGQYRDGLRTVGEAGGVVDESYQRFLDSAGGQWTMLTQNVTALGNAFAGTLLPSVNWGVSGLAKLTGKVGALMERFPALGRTLGFAATGFVSVVAGGWALQYALNLLQGAADGFKLATKQVGAALGWAWKRLVAFNSTALVTAARTRALAVGGALRSFGGALLGLAGRAIPAAIGGLRALGAAALANPIGLAIGGIALGAALIYAYWEPLQGFFKALWQGIQTVFSKAWEGLRATLAFHPVGLLAANWRPVLAFFGRIWQGVSAWLGGLSLFEAGRAILATLGEGIRAAGGLVGDAVRAVFAKVRDLLPFSDARAGPLSTLTASGGQLVTTLGAGIRRAGSAPLRQPLARTLGAATAGLALTLPAAPDLAPRPQAAFGAALAAPPTLRVPPRDRKSVV